MDIWRTLGIEPTEETSVIKKAYAKKLRIFHPEDDPKGFQILRESYDAALKYAKNYQGEKNEISADTENVYEEQQNLEEDLGNLKGEYDNSKYNAEGFNIFNNYNGSNADSEIAYRNQQLIEEFLVKVENLYNDFFARIELKNWEELLNNEIMWNLDCAEIINKKMFKFFTYHSYLPQNVWQHINSIFHWESDKSLPSDYFSEVFINYLLRQVNHERTLRYTYFNKAIDIDYERYLLNRERAFLCILYNQFENAESYLEDAYKIYDKDPELLCMRGECFLRGEKLENASAEFKAAIAINPDDMEIYCYQAEILFNSGKYKKCIEMCNTIKEHSYMDFKTDILVAKCLSKQKRYHSASKILINLLAANNDDKIKMYLRGISEQLKYKLQKHPFYFLHRRTLKEIYFALGDPDKIKDIKITASDVRHLLKIIKKIIKAIVPIVCLTAIMTVFGIRIDKAILVCLIGEGACYLLVFIRRL